VYHGVHVVLNIDNENLYFLSIKSAY